MFSFVRVFVVMVSFPSNGTLIKIAPELREQDNHRVTFSMEPTELTPWCHFGKWPDKDSLSDSGLKVGQ